MPAIDSMLKRFGFVRLSRYGLVLTPEGRIMSLRPEILDDGTGSKIVGWQDRDLAAVELARWEPARPAPQRAVATRVAVAAAPAPVVRIPPLVAAPTPAPVPVNLPEVVRMPVISVAPVAPPPELDEDDWEWTIAIARARAVAEEVQAATIPAPMPSRPSSPRRTRQDTVPPPPSERAITTRTAPPKFISAKTQPMATVAMARDPIDTGDWPKTEPLGTIDYNDYTNPASEVARVVKTAAARAIAPRPAPAPMPAVRTRAPSPTTIIPVPKLPRLADGRTVEPVVSPRRLAKGTGPQLDASARRPSVIPPLPIHPAEDEKTSPGIALPRRATTGGLPRLPGVTRTAPR
jgi:hypothetical protein